MLWKTDKYHQPPLKFQCPQAIALVSQKGQ